MKELRILNLEQNHISKIENLDELTNLETLQLSRNCISDANDLKHLEDCFSITTLDISHNKIKHNPDTLVEILSKMPNLRVLNLMGNEVVRRVKNYRKTLIVKLKNLTYLDDRPVFPRDRACAEAWASGGLEAERVEREVWANKDRKKIQDSVNYLKKIRENAENRRRELGLEPIGGDVELETASLTSESDVESLKSDGSSHISVIKTETKTVSKNIFAEDNMGIEELDDNTSDAYTKSNIASMSRPSSVYSENTRDVSSFADSDVASNASFSLKNLPTEDDVSSVSSKFSEKAHKIQIFDSDSEEEIPVNKIEEDIPELVTPGAAKLMQTEVKLIEELD